MGITIKIHESYRKVVAVCDADLLGKKFVDGKLQLDLKESFYGGKHFPKDKAVNLMKEEAIDDATFNIVGKESINAAIEAGVIENSRNSIIKIQGIPHALGLL